jgi:16S rRNA (adenine1518-N6/adenine1519-N6)-dimethyltransferase
LTAELAARGARVIAVEVDRDLVPLLRAQFDGTANVSIIEGDVLDLAPAEILARGGGATPYSVVANLPYNVAAPVLRMFLEGTPPPVRMTFMVQLEVAEAIVAKPGRMSLLTVATQVYANARIVFKVAPGSFSPPPRVQSAVVHLDLLPQPRVGVPLDAFFRVVRAGFGNPRKQLRNSLALGLRESADFVAHTLEAAGVDPMLRPQALSIEQWERITRARLDAGRA